MEKQKSSAESIAEYNATWKEHIAELGGLGWHLKPEQYEELQSIRARLGILLGHATLDFTQHLAQKARAAEALEAHKAATAGEKKIDHGTPAAKRTRTKKAPAADLFPAVPFLPEEARAALPQARGAYTGPGLYWVELYAGHKGEVNYLKMNAAGQLEAGNAGPNGENFQSRGIVVDPAQVKQPMAPFRMGRA
jgi:hypothetical protein